MYESDLHDMRLNRLYETLSALQRTGGEGTWSVEDATLVAEIREELTRRGEIESPMEELPDTRTVELSTNGNR